MVLVLLRQVLYQAIKAACGRLDRNEQIKAANRSSVYIIFLPHASDFVESNVKNT
jgi:hypothetical protein